MFVLALLMQAATSVVGNSAPDYECDSARGSYDKKELAGAENLQISGVITPIGLGRRSSRWLPAAGILFQPEDGHGGVGLQFWQTSPNALTFGLRRLSPNPDSPVALGSVPIDKPISFTIGMDANQRLEFKVNGKVFSLPNAAVSAKHPILMCSGGHFRFENLSTSIG